ncbi:1488_t:CDS:2, partial [Funneliformis geosporum]
LLNRIRLNEDKISSDNQGEEHPSTNILLCKTQEKPICMACFDLLYQADTIECLWPIIEGFNSHNFQVKTFNLSVSLPSGIIINNHSIKVYVRKKFRERNLSVDLSNILDLKDPFKHLLGWSIEKELGLKYHYQSPFNISIAYYHEDTQQNHLILTRHSRQNIIAALEKTPDSEFISIGNCPPLKVKERWKNHYPILEHAAIYVGGNYIKLSRNISQSPWIINGERLAETSVSECIGEILREKFKCDDYNFVAAGREDSNVRMLGNGRPFYFEIMNPRRPFLSQQELDEAQREINETKKDLIQISQLTMITEKDLSIIKEGEENKKKTYSALVWISKIVTPDIIDKLNQYQDKVFTIQQQTPIRVLQRRAQMVRSKIIYSMKAEPLENHFLTLQLRTEAGTYIKEFIHGDLGRTKPNLGDLLDCYADIMALDVLEVDLEWPPK